MNIEIRWGHYLKSEGSFSPFGCPLFHAAEEALGKKVKYVALHSIWTKDGQRYDMGKEFAYKQFENLKKTKKPFKTTLQPWTEQ